MSERMKIYWPIGLTREMPGRTNRSDLFDQTLNEYARAVMGPDVDVTIAWMKRTTGMMSSPYLGIINDTQIVSDILDAERDGYAAATVGGHWDPALAAAREVCTIPVVGPGRSRDAACRHPRPQVRLPDRDGRLCPGDREQHPHLRA